MNPSIPLKQRLFSSDLAGCVLTPDDLRYAALSLNIEVPKKSREALLEQLRSQAEAEGRLEALGRALSDRVRQRGDRLQTLCGSYPNTQILLTKQISKCHALADDLSQGYGLD
ncbi:MAG: hypothetical protein AB7E49_01135 [Campylobacterales bacterium]